MEKEKLYTDAINNCIKNIQHNSKIFELVERILKLKNKESWNEGFNSVIEKDKIYQDVYENTYDEIFKEIYQKGFENARDELETLEIELTTVFNDVRIFYLTHYNGKLGEDETLEDELYSLLAFCQNKEY